MSGGKKTVPNGLKKTTLPPQNKQLGDSPLTAAGLSVRVKMDYPGPKATAFPFSHTLVPSCTSTSLVHRRSG